MYEITCKELNYKTFYKSIIGFDQYLKYGFGNFEYLDIKEVDTLTIDNKIVNIYKLAYLFSNGCKYVIKFINI